jgi:threonine synthase
MNHVLHLQCLLCGRTYRPDEVHYVCPEHGNEGILDVVYDYAYINRQVSREQLDSHPDPSMWRYTPLLPIRPDAPQPPLRIGGTPLYKTDRLAAKLGLRHLWVKDDGQQPTASLKDRASAIALLKAQEVDAPIITTASTGNAAAALAGVCASVGQKNVIFVPHTAPAAKIAQLLAYGSQVLLVKGNYDQAFDLCLEAADHYGWYVRNTGYNPYMTEGKKTVSYEICTQLDWQAPDVILVSVGDGCIIGGVHKGLKDLRALGWIDQMPRLIGVQAAGSNYLAAAWANKEDVRTKPPIAAQTVADSICAGLPRDRLKAMAAVQETEGAFVTVSDTEILAAIPVLARGSGVFAEPAGAAAYAGLEKAVQLGLVIPEDRVVVLNTGNGLKDIHSTMAAMEQVQTRAYPVVTHLSAVQATLAEITDA